MNLFIESIITVFFSSCDPYLFGSRKRRKEKAKLSKELSSQASGIQSEIEALESQNPFESAASKSAMAQSSRNAKQIQQRYANMLGGNVNPEALIAAQQATQQAVSGTAGDIATGAEALKQNQIAQLRNEKMGLLGQSMAMKQSSIDEIGSGWKSFMQVLPVLSGAVTGGIEGFMGGDKSGSSNSGDASFMSKLGSGAKGALEGLA